MVAGGFALQNREFWEHLLSRGVSTTDAYPKKWFDSKKFQRHIAESSRISKHFVIVELGDDNR